MSERLKLASGSSKYGAQMGRANKLPIDPNAPIKLRMERLRWVGGDYDQWGAYWGHGSGSDVYCAWGEDDEVQVRVFVRGHSRLAARRLVRQVLPAATFYR